MDGQRIERCIVKQRTRLILIQSRICDDSVCAQCGASQLETVFFYLWEVCLLFSGVHLSQLLVLEDLHGVY